MPDRLGDTIRLRHILEAIQEIKSYTEGFDQDGFLENSLVKSGCIRQLEIIGEACNRITEDLVMENPQVAWSDIIGLRNILIHQYFGVDEIVVWGIIEQDLPQFEEDVKAILEEEEE